MSNKSTLKRAISILDNRDKKKFILVSIIQLTLAIMDLIGVLTIGLLGAVSISGLQSVNQSEGVRVLLSLMRIENKEYELQAIIIAGLATILLTGRTVLSVFFTRRILFYMSRKGAEISAEMTANILSQPLLVIQKWKSQELIFSLTRGVEILTLEVLALAAVMFGDLALLTILAIGLLIIDPITFLGVVSIFGVTTLVLHKSMIERAGKYGTTSAELSIKSNEIISEALATFRELSVRNRRKFYVGKISQIRLRFAKVRAEVGFMPYISKYVIETTVLAGAVLLAGVQFAFKDINQALITLTIFAAAGSRIAPAVLRIQQGFVMIKSSLGMANPTLELLSTIEISAKDFNLSDNFLFQHNGFVPSARISNATFKYPGKEELAADHISFSIDAGSFTAIIGPSGSGKSTIADLLLNVIQPLNGEVIIGGHSPSETIDKWPGALAYVPQEVNLINGTFRENLALGFPLDLATDSLVLDLIEKTSLIDVVKGLPKGVDTPLGEGGASLSGGERQRLGIARALFTKPKFLILDEATSALDSFTESEIINSLMKLKGHCTVVVIAHRISTIRSADKLLYIKNGKIIAMGSFEEVRNIVPLLDFEAKNLGM